MSLKRKFQLIVAVAVAGLFAVSGMWLQSERTRILSEKQAETQSLVQAAYSVLDEQHELEVEGLITRHEAQSQAIKIIRAMRYGRGNYFWINDLKPVVIMHASIPELEGKDVTEYKDPTGKKMFVAFVEVIKKSGSGFVSYMWPKPGQSISAKKISFVKGFEPWGWVIGTGIYIDDVDAAWRSNAITAGAIGLACISILLIVSRSVSHSIFRRLESVVDQMKMVGRDDHSLTKRIVLPPANPASGSEAIIRTDEVDLLVAGFNDMISQIQKRDQQLLEHREHLEREVVRRTAELGESEERFRRIVETAQEGIWVIDGEMVTTYVNRRLAEMLGYKAEELIGHPLLKFMDEAARVEKLQHIQRRRQGVREQYEFCFRRKDGSELWTLISASPLVDEKGEFVASMALITDITQRRLAEQALRRSEAELRSLIRNAPYGIYRVTADGKLIDVNPALVEALGYDSEAELLTMNLASVYERPAERSVIVERMLRDRFVRDVEVCWKRKDGTPITVMLNGHYDQDDGEDCVIEGFVDDITEERLLAKQLQQAQKMEAIGRLAGGVAHDFNNLLMVINSYAEMLDEKLEDDPLQEMAHQILKAGERAASLTRELLAFSRQQVLMPSVLDLNKLVMDSRSWLSRLVGKDIELCIVADGELGRVKADASQLQQVIMNLAVNARDAMPSGGKLTIETANAELDENSSRTRGALIKSGSYVMLVMSDTGIGMDKEVQSRIFEPFFTTKELGKGTGLGLSIVYGVVKQSGGHIWAYSEPGRGTTFKIYLPRTDEAGEATFFDDQVRETRRGSETILLVEDEDGVRRALGDFLRSNGYSVLSACSPNLAIQLVEQHQRPIDLLITDVLMPGMNGWELARKLESVRPGLKVLYMSGYTERGVITAGTLDSAHRFLQKPFSMNVLGQQLKALLEEDGTRQKSMTVNL